MNADSATPHSKRLLEKKQSVRRGLHALLETVQVDLAFAFDQFYEARVYTYFALEEKLQGFEDLLHKIEDQINEVETWAELNRTAERLSYVEDRLDELESALYGRSRRRKRRGFSDFFSRFTEKRDPLDGEIASVTEAYQTLGLSEEADLSTVTTAFRRSAKECHPDTKGGDRSAEARLRRVVAAYQFLRRQLSRD